MGPEGNTANVGLPKKERGTAAAKRGFERIGVVEEGSRLKNHFEKTEGLVMIYFNAKTLNCKVLSLPTILIS